MHKFARRRTLLKGLAGDSIVLRLGKDMSIIIEIVDTPDKIDSFLPLLDEMMQEGLVTIEDVKVIRYSQ